VNFDRHGHSVRLHLGKKMKFVPYLTSYYSNGYVSIISMSVST